MDNINENKRAYDFLANEYDEWQDFSTNHLPKLWAEFLNRTYLQFLANKDLENESRQALDLGAGTAEVSINLSKLGWQVLAVDNSQKMLATAETKLKAQNIKSVETKLADISSMDLNRKFDLIYTSLDVFNHLDKEQLKATLKNLRPLFKDTTVLIFDLHSFEYMNTVLADNLYYEIEADSVLLWQNDFSKESLVNRSSLIKFTKAKDSELYKRQDFTINEYYHEIDKLKAYLETLGLKSQSLNNDEFIELWQGNRDFIVAYKKGE